MPVYEYGCLECGEISTVMVRRYESPGSVVCQHCGHEPTQRLVSRVAFKVASRAKYSSDFEEKALPTLKRKFPKEFERAGKGSEEATAHRLSESIGTQMDRVIDKTLKQRGLPG